MSRSLKKVTIGSALPFLLFLWLVVVNFRSCTSAINLLVYPNKPGDDWMWFAGWLGITLLSIAVYAIFPKHASRITRSCVLICSASGLAMIVLSHSIFVFLSVVWLLVLCGGLGFLMFRAFEIATDELVLLACAVPVGFTILALIALILGVFRVLTPVYIVIVLIGLTALTFRPVRAFISCCSRILWSGLTASEASFDRERGLLITIVAVISLMSFSWALAPEIQYDALNYHLTIPHIYLARGAIVEVRFFQAYLARLVELFFALCMAVGGAGAPKLAVFAMSMWAGFCTFALGKLLFGARIGYWSVAFLLTTPLVGWLSGTAYTENILALLITSFFLAMVSWKMTRHTRWLYVAAILAGGAVGSKPTALFALAVAVPLAGITIIREKGLDAATKFREIGYGLLLSGAVALPTYIIVYSYTGNPVFPLFNGIFKSRKWTLDNRILNAAQFGMNTSLASLLRFPYRLSFDTTRFGESYRGVIGVALLLAVPFAFCLMKESFKPTRLLVLSAAAYILLLFYTMQYARYYIPILPVVTILGVAAVFRLSQNRFAPAMRCSLFIALLIQPLTMSLQFGELPERFPISFVTGRESHEAFLARALFGYRAAKYLNSVTLPRQKVLGVDIENVRFYLSSELETLGLALQDSDLRSLLATQPDRRALADNLKTLGFHWIFTTHRAIGEAKPWLPYIEGQFLESQADLAFADDVTSVYRLR